MSGKRHLYPNDFTACESCHGQGTVDCSSCSSRGYSDVTRSRYDSYGRYTSYTDHQPCTLCQGTGQRQCTHCGGTGDKKIYGATTVESQLAIVFHSDGSGIATLEMNADLSTGETVRFRSPIERDVAHYIDFEQVITSMEMDGNAIDAAVAGEYITLVTDEPVQEGDLVFKVGP